jgi:hypothetical protein
MLGYGIWRGRRMYLYLEGTGNGIQRFESPTILALVWMGNMYSYVGVGMEDGMVWIDDPHD